MTNRNLALAGATALVIGLFMPNVTMPIVGTINLFNNGTNILAIVVLALALLAGVLAFNERLIDAFWPGVAAGAVLLYSFARIQYALSQMQKSMEALKDNPFGGIAKAALGGVQLQWGWIVLAAGVGLIIYAAIKARRETDVPIVSMGDRLGRQVTIGAAMLAIIAIGWDIYTRTPTSAETTTDGNQTMALTPSLDDAQTATPSAEEANYIKNSLRLYDFDAKFFDSLLDGRVPGVDFKIKNDGNRTLNRITVKVVFQDAAGKPIAEDEFNPVWVTDSGFGDNDKPLRPNYIWSQESGKSFVSKSVPSEWAEGEASAQITHIEFAK